MRDELLAVVAGVILTFILGFLIAWGANRTKVVDLERRLRHVENENKESSARSDLRVGGI